MSVTESDLYRGYRPKADRTVLGTVTLNVLEERVRALLRYRRWYRLNRWAEWPNLRQDTETELRALVRLLRQSRRLAAPDLLTPDREYHQWQAADGPGAATRGPDMPPHDDTHPETADGCPLCDERAEKVGMWWQSNMAGA